MATTTLPITTVEAFTVGNNQPYTGNPAAVVSLEFDDDIDDETKQNIAQSMNLSETAFISKGWKRGESSASESKQDSGVIQRTLRWFTPLTEVPLCGHATVASAKAILGMEGGSEVRKIEFLSKFRGTLGASVSSSAGQENDLITLDFPSSSSTSVPLDSDWLPEYIRNLLGSALVPDTSDALSSVKDVQFCSKERSLVVRLCERGEDTPREVIRKVSPNFGVLATATSSRTGGLEACIIIVTIQGEGREEEPHFFSRVFVPLFGINEDPVTGMAHGILTPYWTTELGMEGQFLQARQASSRGGDLRCRVIKGEEGDEDRVSIGGRARVLLEGQLNL